MNQLEKAAPDLAVPLPAAGTPRKSVLPFACLHSLNALSGYLLRDVAAVGVWHRNAFPIPIQKRLEKKRRNTIKYLAMTNREILFPWFEAPARRMRLMKRGLCITGLKSQDKSRPCRNISWSILKPSCT